MPASLAAGDAELERIEAQHPVAHLDAGGEVLERQLLRPLDGAGLDAHVGVDAVPARLESNGASGSTPDFARLSVPTTTPEVGEVEHLGVHIAAA